MGKLIVTIAFRVYVFTSGINELKETEKTLITMNVQVDRTMQLLKTTLEKCVTSSNLNQSYR